MMRLQRHWLRINQQTQQRQPHNNAGSIAKKNLVGSFWMKSQKRNSGNNREL